MFALYKQAPASDVPKENPFLDKKPFQENQKIITPTEPYPVFSESNNPKNLPIFGSDYKIKVKCIAAIEQNRTSGMNTVMLRIMYYNQHVSNTSNNHSGSLSPSFSNTLQTNHNSSSAPGIFGSFFHQQKSTSSINHQPTMDDSQGMLPNISQNFSGNQFSHFNSCSNTHQGSPQYSFKNRHQVQLFQDTILCLEKLLMPNQYFLSKYPIHKFANKKFFEDYYANLKLQSIDYYSLFELIKSSNTYKYINVDLSTHILNMPSSLTERYELMMQYKWEIQCLQPPNMYNDIESDQETNSLDQLYDNIIEGHLIVIIGGRINYQMVPTVHRLVSAYKQQIQEFMLKRIVYYMNYQPPPFFTKLNNKFQRNKHEAQKNTYYREDHQRLIKVERDIDREVKELKKRKIIPIFSDMWYEGLTIEENPGYEWSMISRLVQGKNGPTRQYYMKQELSDRK